MTKSAVLLNPQVVVEPGDHRDLYDSFAEVRRLFGEASDVLGFDLANAFFNGDADRINRGEIVRPASLAIASAIFRMVADRHGEPDYVAGLSLGEVVAGHLSGSIGFADAVRTAHVMPRIEDEVCGGLDLGVAFYYGVDVPALERDMAVLVEEGALLSPCAHTADDQMIVTGHTDDLGALNRRAMLAGGIGVIIPHGPPAHSPLPALAQVQRRFRDEHRYLEPVRDPRIPIMANTTAELLTTADQVMDEYVSQYTHTVHWTRGLRRMRDLGVGRVRVVGPGHFVMKSLRSTGIDFAVESYLTPEDIGTVLSV